MKNIKEKVEESIVEIFKQNNNYNTRESRMIDLHITLAELSRYVWDLRNYRNLELWVCSKCKKEILLHLVHDPSKIQLIICPECYKYFNDVSIEHEFPNSSLGLIVTELFEDSKFYYYSQPSDIFVSNQSKNECDNDAKRNSE